MGDTFRVLASEDNTLVTVNGAIVAILDRGEVHEQIIEVQSMITANRPVLVAQFSNGQDYDTTENDKTKGDPFMALLPPAEQYLDQYTITTPANGYSVNYVNLVTSTVSVGQIRLNGETIPTNL